MSGYTRGTNAAPSSPVSLDEFDRLKRAVLFTDDDVGYLRISRGVLEDQVEDVLDAWYGFVGSHPFLLYYFTNRDTGLPEAEYLVKTRERFGRWILDTAAADYDQAWLDYQYEIGLRHHRSGKNRTDGSRAVEHINYRYLPPFIYPITATLKPFLARKGHGAEEVEKMHQAWLKSVILQVTLWSQPYVKEGDF
ncbi:MAG: protoglobin domain-containing protein [Chloroflexota bacterium]|nr:protoglobin domain-containing protein [Chloroflexota bacterium]